MQHQSSTKLEATVFDPASRSPLFTAISAMLVAATLAAIVAQSLTLFGLAVALVFAWDMRRRRGPKKTRITCRAGAIVVPGRGLIRARDIHGATTARIAERIVIVLSHRRRPRTPIVLDVADEASLATVCRSLGIGHNGFGRIDFISQPTVAERWRYAANAIAAGSLGVSLVPAFREFGAIATLVVLAVAVLAFVRVTNPPPTVRLTSGGVFVPLRAGVTFLPFHLIEDVVLRPGELVVRVRTANEAIVHVVRVGTSTWLRQSCSPAELECLVAQIRAAVDRAHGKFVFKPEPQVLASQLKRLENESIPDWRARIDTIGVGAAGYRATAIDAAELWTLFEDPEADGEVRAAAARILDRLDRESLRVRVGDVLATVRDETVRARIADAIDRDEDADDLEPVRVSAQR